MNQNELTKTYMMKITIVIIITIIIIKLNINTYVNHRIKFQINDKPSLGYNFVDIKMIPRK